MATEVSRDLVPGLHLARSVRRPVPILLGLLVIAIFLCIPLAMAAKEKHNEFITLQMQGIATRVLVPAGLTTRSRGDCPDQTYLVACWTSPQAPDELAATMTTGLKSAAGGSSVATGCETLSFGSRPRSCLITYRRGDHAVSISVDTNNHWHDGKMVATGSRIRMDAL